MTKVCVAAAAVILAVAMLATGLGYGVNRDRYVAANRALFEELPMYPGARLTSVSSHEYRASESPWSPVRGYVTLFLLDLPSDTDPEHVAAFYERKLAGEWHLMEKITEPPFAAGPILNFRRGEARLSVNLESWRGGVLEIAVDHGG